MNVSLAELRRTMYQRYDPNTRRLAPATFFEDSRTRAFRPGDLAELYHENTKYVPGVMDRARRSIAEFERRSMRYVAARIDQDYAGRERVALPEPAPLDCPMAEALRSRRSRRQYGPGVVSTEALSQLLNFACGVTATREIADDDLDGVRKHFRAYPSAGALYPVEVYPVVRRSQDLDPGVYYYVPTRHRLRSLLPDDVPTMEEALDPTSGAVGFENASVIVVLTGAFPRATSKYGPRGYRYVLQESGHLAQNLLLVASGLGLRSVPLGGFYDDLLNDLLGVDGVEEAALYAVAVGTDPERGEVDR